MPIFTYLIYTGIYMYIVPMLIIVVIQTLNLLQSLKIRVDFMIPKIKKTGGAHQSCESVFIFL